MIYLQIPKPGVLEGASVVATAHSRLGYAGNVPASARYRIDCGTTGQNVVGWTSLTPAASMAISWTAALISQSHDLELKVITVEEDTGLSTQDRDSVTFVVRNLVGIS